MLFYVKEQIVLVVHLFVMHLPGKLSPQMRKPVCAILNLGESIQIFRQFVLKINYLVDTTFCYFIFDIYQDDV